MQDIPRRDILTQGGVALAGLATAALAASSSVANAASTDAPKLRRYIIERDLVGVGKSSPKQLCGIAQTSNDALAQLAPHIQWEHSYFADDKTFCVYLAESEDAIRRHGELSGFPVTRITAIDCIVDPTTALNTPT
jgi:hypothetical protein